MKRLAVVGAGPAGLMASLAAHHQGLKVSLFESHSKPGGSASYFKRKTAVGEAVFDAGATVVNALEQNQALERLAKTLSLSLPAHESVYQVGYLFSECKTLQWMPTTSIKEQVQWLVKTFPQDHICIEQKIAPLAQLAQSTQRAFATVPHLPFQRLRDIWWSVPALVKLLPQTPLLATSLEQNLLDYVAPRQISKDLREWINMNLLITLQCGIQDARVLWAAMALFFYPLGTASPLGGMKAIFESLLNAAKSRFEVHTKTPVLMIRSDATGWWLQTPSKNFGPFDGLALAIPRYNSELLFEEPLLTPPTEWNRLRQSLWSAGVAYFVFPEEEWFPKTAFHLHSRVGSGEASNGGECYWSFSSSKDVLRNPPGYRVATCSTHVRLGQWTSREAPYKENKATWGTELFGAHRKALKLPEPVYADYATPLTFERYTRRLEGSVGGLPMNFENTLWHSPSMTTRFPTVFQIGDTSFPGQSIYATSMGAIACVEKITGQRFHLSP